MNNNRNFFFPSKETGETASMSSRSKTGAKMEASVYELHSPIFPDENVVRTKYLCASRGSERLGIILER